MGILFAHPVPTEGKMSDQHITNNFFVTGDGNSIDFDQSITSESGALKALELVLKFLLAVLLSPVLIPIILGANGYRMLRDSRQGGSDDE